MGREALTAPRGRSQPNHDAMQGSLDLVSVAGLMADQPQRRIWGGKLTLLSGALSANILHVGSRR